MPHVLEVAREDVPAASACPQSRSPIALVISSLENEDPNQARLHKELVMKSVFCCLLTFAFASSLCGVAYAADSRPNFILMMGDDHGW